MRILRFRSFGEGNGRPDSICKTQHECTVNENNKNIVVLHQKDCLPGSFPGAALAVVPRISPHSIWPSCTAVVYWRLTHKMVIYSVIQSTNISKKTVQSQLCVHIPAVVFKGQNNRVIWSDKCCLFNGLDNILYEEVEQEKKAMKRENWNSIILNRTGFV